MGFIYPDTTTVSETSPFTVSTPRRNRNCEDVDLQSVVGRSDRPEETEYCVYQLFPERIDPTSSDDLESVELNTIVHTLQK
jgi:hypothetical protein